MTNILSVAAGSWTIILVLKFAIDQFKNSVRL